MFEFLEYSWFNLAYPAGVDGDIDDVRSFAVIRCLQAPAIRRDVSQIESRGVWLSNDTLGLAIGLAIVENGRFAFGVPVACQWASEIWHARIWRAKGGRH